MHELDEELRVRLNAETGKISWQELERHFARGVLVVVSRDLDLVDVAFSFTNDHKEKVAGWISDGRVAVATAEHAEQWNKTNPTFWAVVTAPWVLAQEVVESDRVIH